MATTTSYQFQVDMTCQACVNAIKKSLTKAYGDELQSVDADIDTKKVTISLKKSGEPYNYEQVYEALSRTGRTITKLPN